MTAVSVTAVGNQPWASGFPSQGHLIYAQNTGRWWCFWFDPAATSLIKCRVSSSADLSTATWSDPTGASAPGDGFGETITDSTDFGVAYKSIGSVDVLHFEKGATSGVNFWHMRATITAATTITWGSWADNVLGVNTQPEGPVVEFSSDNHVHIASCSLINGGDGNPYAAASTNTDSGSAWTDGWGSDVRLQASPNYEHHMALFDVGSGNMLAIFGDGNAGINGGNNNQCAWARSTAQTWTADSGAVFGTSSSQDISDWDAVARTTSDVHFVRRTGATSFDHRRFNGTDWTTLSGSTVPSSGITGHLAGSGLFLATDGTSVWLFMIDSATNRPLMVTQWQSGSGWGAWTAVTNSTDDSSFPTKNHISGFRQAVSGQLNVIYTNGSSSPYGLITSAFTPSAGGVTSSAALAGAAVLASAGHPLQIAFAVSDTSVGAWSTQAGATTNLYQSIDEANADDTDYDRSPQAPTASPYTVRLGTLAAPVSGNRFLHYRYGKDIAGSRIDLQVELMQGATVIQTFTHTDIPLGWTATDQQVTNTITDWTTPFDVRFTATQL